MNNKTREALKIIGISFGVTIPIALLVAAIIVFMVRTTNASSTGCPKWRHWNGYYVVGNDIGTLSSVQNFDACTTLCDNDPHCYGVSYNSDSKECYKKGTITPIEGYTFAAKDYPVLDQDASCKKYTQVHDVIVLNNDQSTSTGTSIEDCASQCDNLSGCMGVGYYANSNTCTFKQGIAATAATRSAFKHFTLTGEISEETDE